MTHYTYNPSLPLTERKAQLEQIATGMEAKYGLTRSDLAKYIIPNLKNFEPEASEYL